MLPHTVCILSWTEQVGFLFHPGFHKTHIHNARPGGGEKGCSNAIIGDDAGRTMFPTAT